jgi:hypothetical protein
MDVETFWDSIKFKPLYKENGMWVMGAFVDSGIQVQLMVISKNKGERLTDMDWKYIYGIKPTGEIKRVQHFEYPPNIGKVLICRGRDFKETKYLHKFEPYMVIKKHDPRMIDQFQCEDTCPIMEIFSQPGFTVKKI